jgi:hypothetical protein
LDLSLFLNVLSRKNISNFLAIGNFPLKLKKKKLSINIQKKNNGKTVFVRTSKNPLQKIQVLILTDTTKATCFGSFELLKITFYIFEHEYV